MSSWWVLPALVTLGGSGLTALLARRAAEEAAAARVQVVALAPLRSSTGAVRQASALTRERARSTADAVRLPGHR